MATFLDSVSIQIFIDEWIDITEYVVEDINADWGILDSSPSSRIGYVGGMSILLNNENGLFTPNGESTLPGWNKGIKIRNVLIFEGISYVRFKGKIKKIGLPYKVGELSIVPVHAVDWFDESINKKLNLQQIETDKTTAESVQIILDGISVQPDNVDMDEGKNTLDSIFTNTNLKTTAYSELSKLALSEFSFIYLRKDRKDGETLKVESRQSRIGKSVSDYIKSKSSSPKLLLQDGSYLLLQNGSRLLLNKIGHTTFNNMYEMEAEYGENLINQLSVRNNPSRTSDEYQILFSLDKPIEIAAGKTIPDLEFTYKDPTGGNIRVNGSDMQTPVIDTDYKMWTGINGNGIDLTSYLTFTVEFGSSGGVFRSITNTGTRNGFITKLNARGYAVYLDNPINLLFEDEVSQSEFGIVPLTYNNHYQSDINISRSIGQLIISINKDNQIVPRKIKLVANINSDLMLAFLNLDVGDLIPIQQNKHGIDGSYFIHSVKYKIYQGGAIEFEWGLTDSYLASKTMWKLGRVGASELGSTTVVSF